MHVYGVSLYVCRYALCERIIVVFLFQDLKSANIIEVSMAMNVICRLVTKEMIPAFVPLIQEKMVHPK